VPGETVPVPSETVSARAREGDDRARAGTAALGTVLPAVAALVLFAAGALGIVAGPAAARPAAPPLLTVTLSLRVARCPPATVKGKRTRGAHRAPVKPKAWVDAQLAAARKLLAPYRIALVARRSSFTPARCELDTRAQRHALAEHAISTGAVDVLVLRRVRDLDVRSYNLMGVHWRYRGGRKAWRGRRFVILTARARAGVLAHELCHFFGLKHDPKGGNLMAPGPSSPLRRRRPPPKPWKPRLERWQARRLRAAIIRFTRKR